MAKKKHKKGEMPAMKKSAGGIKHPGMPNSEASKIKPKLKGGKEY